MQIAILIHTQILKVTVMHLEVVQQPPMNKRRRRRRRGGGVKINYEARKQEGGSRTMTPHKGVYNLRTTDSANVYIKIIKLN